MSNEKNVIIVDGYNQFIRNYMMDPSVSKHGFPIGACKGFLKSLQKEARSFQPEMIIVVWDGAGGSKKKRKLFAEYKEGRKPVRFNRNNEIFKQFSDQEESENKRWQFVRLIEYLNDMPIVQFMIDDVEADDIIARICNLRKLSAYKKIIISSDKDFLQLCSEDVVLFRPIKEETYDTNAVINEYNIHPNNFALARSIAGDQSDNLKGIGGAGLRTVSKRLPFLKEEKNYTIDELFEFCEKQDNSKLKIFSDVLSNKDKIALNYKMMQLYTPNMSPVSAKKIKDTIDDFKPEFHQTEIIKKMIIDGLTDFNWETLFGVFRSISSTTKFFKTS